MLSRVRVNDPGETDLLPGEIIERVTYLNANDKVAKIKRATSKRFSLVLQKFHFQPILGCHRLLSKKRRVFLSMLPSRVKLTVLKV